MLVKERGPRMDAIGSCERKKSTDLDRFVREQMPAATATTEPKAQGRAQPAVKKRNPPTARTASEGPGRLRPPILSPLHCAWPQPHRASLRRDHYASLI